MEMKLNSKLIRELRLARSWTQEQLAEKARLNPRTIQRVEMDGQGSLRTRAQLAIALGISPAELDLPEDQPFPAAPLASGRRGALQEYASQMSMHALALQFLVTLLFLGTAEMYFSQSKVGFSWINISLGRQWWWVPEWWEANFLLLALVSAPLLAWVWMRGRRWLLRAVATVLVTLFFSILRLWEPALTETLLTTAVFFAGLTLLVCQWSPRVPLVHAEHLLYGALFAYFYVWVIQVYAFQFPRWTKDGIAFDVPWAFLDNILWIRLPKLVPLIPAICVLLLAWGRRSTDGSNPRALAAQKQEVKATDKNSADQYCEADLIES